MPKNGDTLFFGADIHKEFSSRPRGGLAPGRGDLEGRPPDQIIRDLEDDAAALAEALSDCQINVPPRSGTALDFLCEHEDPADLEHRCDVYEACRNRPPSALRQFATYILQPKFRNTVFLAHYGSGFDHHFLFMELHRMGVRLDTIFKGNKLVSFSVPALNMRFIDFFCFVPTGLKNLEKSFNLTTGSKGFFPHLLNKPEFYGLTLPHLPPKSFYEPDLMKAKDGLELEAWYAQTFGQRFNFAEQMTFYCETDVLILLSACLTFVRETLVQQTEFRGKIRDLEPNDTPFWLAAGDGGERVEVKPGLVHPFCRDVATLSTYANVLFRSYYLVEDQLPIVTHGLSESFSDRSSREEAEYLAHVRRDLDVPDLEFGAAHLRQRRFVVVCPETQRTHAYYVDGYSPATKVRCFFFFSAQFPNPVVSKQIHQTFRKKNSISFFSKFLTLAVFAFQTVYEYNGCIFHGCPDCFSPETPLRNGLSNHEGQRLTEKRLRLLRRHPDVDRVVVMRSCRWARRARSAEGRPPAGSPEGEAVRRLCIKQTFRGGVVEPLALSVDADVAKSRLRKIYGCGPDVDTLGSFIDINSMYPSQLTPDYSHSSRPVDYVMSPIGAHVILLGHRECTQACDATCVPGCGRFDRHDCLEGVNCFRTCGRHFGPEAWGKLPGFALVRIVPPKNVRFPILRLQLRGDSSGKNFSTLCAACAGSGVAFEGLKECRHSDEERAIFGEFTTGERLFHFCSKSVCPEKI